MLADAHAFVQHQLADVDLDVLRNIGRQTFDVDLAPDELEEAALLLDALGLAFDDHRNRDVDGAVHPDAVEVRVQQRVRDRIELVFLDQHARVAGAAKLQRDERVGPRLRVENLQERAGIDGNRRRVPAAPSALAP